jgi:hypothetical protein
MSPRTNHHQTVEDITACIANMYVILVLFNFALDCVILSTIYPTLLIPPSQDLHAYAIYTFPMNHDLAYYFLVFGACTMTKVVVWPLEAIYFIWFIPGLVLIILQEPLLIKYSELCSNYVNNGTVTTCDYYYTQFQPLVLYNQIEFYISIATISFILIVAIVYSALSLH